MLSVARLFKTTLWAALLAVPLLVCSPLNAHGQRHDVASAGLERNPSLPTVTFTYELEGAIPSRYAVSIESTGNTTYHSDGPQQELADYRTPSGTPTGEPYNASFTISRPTRERVFILAEKLKYFQGDFDYKKGKIANTGAKTLIYADAQRRNQTTYNWSQDLQIQELTALFQNISTTMEFGRRLQFMHRFSKLGLDGELKQMEEVARQNNLAELQAVEPILTSIVNDTSVMRLARARARGLLDSMLQPAIQKSSH